MTLIRSTSYLAHPCNIFNNAQLTPERNFDLKKKRCELLKSNAYCINVNSYNKAEDDKKMLGPIWSALCIAIDWSKGIHGAKVDKGKTGIFS